jgi:hypothetical protein
LADSAGLTTVFAVGGSIAVAASLLAVAIGRDARVEAMGADDPCLLCPAAVT